MSAWLMIWLTVWALIALAMPVAYGFNKRSSRYWVDGWTYAEPVLLGWAWPAYALGFIVTMASRALAWIGGRVARG